MSGGSIQQPLQQSLLETSPSVATSSKGAEPPMMGVSMRFKNWLSKKLMLSDYGGKASDAGDLFLGLMAPVVAGASAVAGASLFWPVTLGLGVLALVAGRVIENNKANSEFQEFTKELIAYLTNVQSIFFNGLTEEELQYQSKEAHATKVNQQQNTTSRKPEEEIEDKAKECIYRMSMMYHTDYTMKTAFGWITRLKSRFNIKRLVFPNGMLAKLRNELLFLTSYLTLVIQQKVMKMQGDITKLQSLVVLKMDSTEVQKLLNQQVGVLERNMEAMLMNTKISTSTQVAAPTQSAAETQTPNTPAPTRAPPPPQSFTQRFRSFFGSGGRTRVKQRNRRSKMHWTHSLKTKKQEVHSNH